MMIDMMFEWIWLVDWWPFLGLLGFIWAPKSWTPGELVSAAAMNTNIRDHLNESLRTQTTALTGTQNNFALEGPFAYLQCTNASALTITGALIDSGNVNGARVLIEPIDKNVIFKHQDAGSTTSNRFITPNAGDLTIAAFERGLAIYDGTNSRWRITRAATNAIVTETTALTGTQDDFAVSDPVAYLTCTNATELVLTGVALDSGNIDGARLLIEALSADVKIAHQQAGSVAANRIITFDGGDLTLKVSERALAVYDGANSRWRVDRAGASAIVKFLNIITGAITSSAFHMGEASDEGGWFTSQSDDEFIISMGAERVSGAWYARATESAAISLNTANIGFYYDSGLTDGNTFTPTLIAAINASALDLDDHWLQMDERADAGAPGANIVRIYARDTGGKTELVARFATGAIQQIAIEP